MEKQERKAKSKRCGLRMIQYEVRNMNGNLMSHFFGIVFPNVMCLILSKTVGTSLSADVKREVMTTIMLSMSLIMPMSIMMLGYGAVYSQEVEKGVPLRMRLFGFGEKSLIAAKIIAHLILLTVSFIVFALFQILVMDIQKPALGSLICLILSLYFIGAVLLVIAYALAGIFKKFSVTFGICMTIYFMMMILTGMMGMKTNQLPDILQSVAKTLPMTYISNDFITFWQGGSYNFMPYIQSCIFFAALAGLLLMASFYKNRRVVK